MVRPQTLHLLFGLCLLSKPAVKWWRILKEGKESKKIKITRAAKLEAQSPGAFFPFALSPPLSSDATWSLAQVTALFNDAICLMLPCACQSISHYPSPRLSPCTTGSPWLRRTTKPCLEHHCSGSLGASPRLIGGKHDAKDKEENNSKRVGRWWADLLSYLFPIFSFLLMQEVPRGHKVGWEKKSTQNNMLRHELTAHVEIHILCSLMVSAFWFFSVCSCQALLLTFELPPSHAITSSTQSLQGLCVQTRQDASYMPLPLNSALL